MPERYTDAILKYLAARHYQPLKPRQLARQMGVAEEDYDTFRTAIKVLRDAGQVVMGAKNALTLPQMSKQVVGFFRANPRGFGFVIPEQPNASGDLFIPPEAAAGAMTGDLVLAEVVHAKRRGAETMFSGVIREVLKRGRNRYVGTLDRADDGTWFVLPDGKEMTTPIVVRDISQAGPPVGTKVVAEILQYGQPGQLPTGVIVESLGEKGELEAETLSAIRAYGLAEEFPPAAEEEARCAVQAFDGGKLDGREDLTALTVVTIDPPDARDYDDAISLARDIDGRTVLGVHIADVSYFVREGGALDQEARRRGTSVYFPRKVLPMLPVTLSNGVCSLQEGQDRCCLSAFITYDEQGQSVATRFAESVIRSSKRLTYQQAQEICDGKTGGYSREVAELVVQLEKLARRIESRRRKDGMLHLDLPDVELVFDAAGKVVDARPEDSSYSHTVIEMFMVEANDAVAELLSRLDRPCLRRIHPAPDKTDSKQLKNFIRACGHKLPAELTRRELQDLLETVRGRPESYAVNLAVLKTMQRAEYSPMLVGHFALASENYCHFTSPIRRYPDLTVHRLVREHCRGRLKDRPPEDVPALTKLGQDCTAAEKRAEAAENELREVLVLQLLTTRIGETFAGAITGVANFGVFVQSPQFLIEGLVTLEDLGDDWWEVNADHGEIRGQRTGRRHRIGDVIQVQIAGVDVARRRLHLVPVGQRPRQAKPAEARQDKGPQDKPRTSARKGREPVRKAKAPRGKGRRRRRA